MVTVYCSVTFCQFSDGEKNKKKRVERERGIIGEEKAAKMCSSSSCA